MVRFVCFGCVDFVFVLVELLVSTCDFCLDFCGFVGFILIFVLVVYFRLRLKL